MKTHISNAAIAFLVMPGLFIALSQCTEGGDLDDSLAPENAGLKSAGPSTTLSSSEIDAILFMREEEKLARDVYLHLYEVFPLRPFLNISKSEQAHMDAILYLIEACGLEDPAANNPEGVFQNPGLQQLYGQLVETGSESRTEALRVGALIEEVDIADLQAALEETAENEQVVRVFTNLCNASERHLKAFVSVLERYGLDYEPVQLEQEVFDRIISD